MLETTTRRLAAGQPPLSGASLALGRPPRSRSAPPRSRSGGGPRLRSADRLARARRPLARARGAGLADARPRGHHPRPRPTGIADVVGIRRGVRRKTGGFRERGIGGGSATQFRGSLRRASGVVHCVPAPLGNTEVAPIERRRVPSGDRSTGADRIGSNPKSSLRSLAARERGFPHFRPFTGRKSTHK